MSNTNRSDDSWIFLVVALVVGTVAYIVWQFSTFFGLDINTGASVFLRLVLLTATTFAFWKFSDNVEFLELRRSWPVLLALLWACWWPALDFWSAKQSPFRYRLDEIETMWWAAWYSKWGGFVLLVGGGYLFNKWHDDRY